MSNGALSKCNFSTLAPRMLASTTIGLIAQYDIYVPRPFSCFPSMSCESATHARIRGYGNTSIGTQNRLTEHLNKCSSFGARVQQSLPEALRIGKISIPEIARTLAVSERTLQRYLHSEGTSYEKILDQARRELAMAYISDKTLALGEIATMLGYAELSPFSRAFRRWTGGVGPREYRHRRLP